jgi:hypothetical protein
MITHKYSGEDNRPDAVEPAVYPATIKGAREGVSKSGGNDQIELVWELDNGHLIYDYLTFTSKTGFKVDSFLKSIGIAPDAKGVEIEIDAADLIGKRAFLDVRIEKDDYGTKNKVSKYITDRGIPEQPKNDEVKQEGQPF